MLATVVKEFRLDLFTKVWHIRALVRLPGLSGRPPGMSPGSSGCLLGTGLDGGVEPMAQII